MFSWAGVLDYDRDGVTLRRSGVGQMRRPSPGTVLGGLALIVAMSGVAIAAIPGSNGVVTTCLKGSALRVIDAEAGTTCKNGEKTLRLAGTNAAGEVANADKLDGKNSTDFLGVTAKAADSDKLDGIDSAGFLGASAKAADSDKLDGKDSADFLTTGNVMWAVVRADATSARSSGTVFTFRASAVGTGGYVVDFARPIGACALSLTLASPDTTDASGGFIVGKLRPTAFDPPSGPTQITVNTSDPSGVGADRSFHVIVAC